MGSERDGDRWKRDGRRRVQPLRGEDARRRVPTRRRGGEIRPQERGEECGERRECGCESTGRETLALFARVGAGVGARADAGSRKRPKLACELSLAGGPILHQSGLAQSDVQPTKRCENCMVGAMQVRGKKPNTHYVSHCPQAKGKNDSRVCLKKCIYYAKVFRAFELLLSIPMCIYTTRSAPSLVRSPCWIGHL